MKTKLVALIAASVTSLALEAIGADAVAAAHRARTPLYQSQNNCANPSTSAPEAGLVRFERKGNTVSALVQARGAIPNEEYVFYFDTQTGCTTVRTGAFRTDSRGNGRGTAVGTVTSGDRFFQVTLRRASGLAFVAQTIWVELQP